MKKLIVYVLACVIAVGALLFTELKEGQLQDADFVDTVTVMLPDGDGDTPDASVSISPDTEAPPAPTTTAAVTTQTAPVTEAVTETQDNALISYGEDYYTVDDVAYYLAEYEELPPNYMTKKEAEALGWISSEGNLWDVAPGACIGGDRFGNYEGLLPKSGRYTECDVNYEGGYRGGERLVFDTDGNIWYTADHYSTFELLYGED